MDSRKPLDFDPEQMKPSRTRAFADEPEDFLPPVTDDMGDFDEVPETRLDDISPSNTAITSATAPATKAPVSFDDADKTSSTPPLPVTEATAVAEPSVATTAGAFMVGMLTLACIVGAVAWAVSYASNSRKAFRVPATEHPIHGMRLTRVEAERAPRTTNGKRMTVAFWIYVHDLTKFEGVHRRVWVRGDATDDWRKASPAVYIDGMSNKLHITFGAVNPDPSDGKTMDEEQLFAYMRTKRGVTVDYIPLQRWVHVAAVVNEEVDGGTVTVYLNGELTKIADSKAVRKISDKIDAKLTVHEMNLDKRGAIYVGGDAAGSGGPGFEGLVSRILIANYDLNASDVFNEYRRGPLDKRLSSLGLNAYGLQTPVYRVG